MSQSNYTNLPNSQSPKIKPSPSSEESEMMVLGGMLTSINSVNIACDLLSEDDFYYSQHKMIYRVIYDCFKRDLPIDNHIIFEELRRTNQLEVVGGMNRLVALSQYAGTSSNMEEYARIVKDKAILRRIINLTSEIGYDAAGEPEDVPEFLEKIRQKFFKIDQGVGDKSFKTAKDVLDGKYSESGLSFMQELEQRQQEFIASGGKEVPIKGVRTGFVDLDLLIQGMGNSNLIILAARPAMGKTAFGMNIVEHACFNLHKRVGVFSLEMDAHQIIARLIAAMSEVNSNLIKTGNVTADDFHHILEAYHKVIENQLFIDDQPGISIATLRARARRMKEAHGIDLLVIDYLQLLSGTGSKGSQDNRQQEVSEISRLLKQTARELNIPVLCLAQLNRKAEERAGHKPIMSDLRESGAIEQDSDVIMFLHRAEYYDKLQKPGMAECIVAKNRHGRIGSVDLQFNKTIAKFGTLASLEECKNLAYKD